MNSGGQLGLDLNGLHWREMGWPAASIVDRKKPSSLRSVGDLENRLGVLPVGGKYFEVV